MIISWTITGPDHAGPDKCWSGPACRHPKWVRTSVCPGTPNSVPAYRHGTGLSHKVGRTLDCSFALIRLNIGHSEVGICGRTSVDHRLSEVYTYTFGSFWILWVFVGIFGYLLDLFGSFGYVLVFLGIFWFFLDLLGMWWYFGYILDLFGHLG